MKPNISSRYVLVAAAAAALSISASVGGCSAPSADAAPADAARPIAVTVARVAMTDVASTIDSGGVVQARTTAMITARIWRRCARSAYRRAIGYAQAETPSCSTAAISRPVPVPRARQPLPPSRARRQPQPGSRPRKLASSCPGVPQSRRRAEQGAPPPRRSSTTPRRRCGARSARRRRVRARARTAGRVGSRERPGRQ